MKYQVQTDITALPPSNRYDTYLVLADGANLQIELTPPQARRLWEHLGACLQGVEVDATATA